MEQFQVTRTRTNNNKCDALRALLRSHTEELEHFFSGLYRAISGFKKKNKHWFRALRTFLSDHIKLYQVTRIKININ